MEGEEEVVVPRLVPRLAVVGRHIAVHIEEPAVPAVRGGQVTTLPIPGLNAPRHHTCSKLTVP